ncbi:MAG: PAS domain-containing protein, partial [Candidatus Thorarchaeota archaeon]
MTEHRQDFAEVMQSELREFLQTPTLDAVFFCDYDGNILNANHQALKLFDYSASEFLTLNFCDLRPSCTLVSTKALLEETVKYGVVGIEVDLKKRTNGRFIGQITLILTHFDGKNLVQGIVRELIEGTFSSREDITDQHLTEKAIKDQRDFLERVIESLTHPFYVIDANSHKITMANKAANLGDIDENSTCYSLTHRRNEPCNGIEHPCPLQEVKMTKKPVIVEHVHYNEDGDMRYLEVHAYPVLDSRGNVTQMIEYDFDVTEQKWVEKQLEIESRRARLYLDLLAHDVANQLQIIWSCTELINGIPLLPESHEKLSSFLNHIEESVKNCRSMILRAKSTEQLPLTPLLERDLKKVIYECIEIVSEKLDEFNAIIAIDVSEAHVLADKFLEQLLECLIENAVMHNSKDTKNVWIKLKQVGMTYELRAADNAQRSQDSPPKRTLDH